MNLKVLPAFGVFSNKPEVIRIVVENSKGSFGLLPNRLDGVSNPIRLP